ncbi:MAG TPA: Uma2 family endonuclease [Kofleriaceae bacterium]|nr:Uma2 family endonuclease [Kofleriaceae bacterium]
MRAVWLGVPESFLEERRRLGLDARDELWEGVLHMVPPPAWQHSIVQGHLYSALLQIARRRGLDGACEGGVFAAEKNWRVPDIIFVRDVDAAAVRRPETAELVVEILSPDDESRDKLPFYAKVGVREVWLVEPGTREVEILTLVAGRYEPVLFVDGRARSPLLGIDLRVADGKLELRDGAELHVI